MNATQVYLLLHQCRTALDDSCDHAIAAYVGQAMALLQAGYDIDRDLPMNLADDV